MGPSQFWKIKRDFQVSFLKEKGLAPDHTVLDFGCGTLRGGIPIIDYLQEGKYYGIDIRERVLLEARKELKEERLEHKNPNLVWFTNFSDLHFDEKFDFILAFSVLFHLSDDILDKALEFVSKNLAASSGKFYANALLGNSKGGGRWEEFPVKERTFDFYLEVAKKHNLKVKKIGVLKDFGHLTNYHKHDLQPMLEFELDSEN